MAWLINLFVTFTLQILAQVFSWYKMLISSSVFLSFNIANLLPENQYSKSQTCCQLTGLQIKLHNSRIIVEQFFVVANLGF